MPSRARGLGLTRVSETQRKAPHMAGLKYLVERPGGYGEASPNSM